MTVRDIILAASGVGGVTPPVTTDPQFPYVSMLLNDTGTNGAQNNTFLDSSSNSFTITRNGTPTQGSVTPYWPNGQWSNYFSGSAQYIGTASNSAYAFGTGDFTVEYWVYETTWAAAPTIIDLRNSATSASGYSDHYSTAGKFNLYWNNATVYTSTASVLINSWNHVAVTRSGTTVSVFINGTLDGSFTSNFNMTDTSCRIGANVNTTPTAMTGYLSNVRIVKGTALYTANFTPSTTPLTAVSGTSLLTCQSNRFKDNSSNNFAITVTGTPSVQAFEPFSPAASYNTIVGGSGYFSGTSQYLSAGSSGSALAFGTGDFTIEAWVYPTTIKAQRIYDGRDGSNGFFPTLGMVAGGSFTYFNNGLTRITSSTLAKVNNWYHVAVCRSGTSTRLFINGIQEGVTYVDSSNYITTLSSPYIGIDGITLGTVTWAGYISDLRALKGTAVYTTTFTPPTSPLAAITNTSLLLSCTNAGIYDSAVLNDLVTVGDAKVSTAQVKFGSSSMAFDGTGDYLSTSETLPFVFGTGDWTIETWLNPSVISLQRIYDTRPSFNGAYVTIGMNATGKFDLTANSAVRITGTTTAVTGNWYHVAVCRSGTSTKLFVNGVQEGVTYTDSTNYIVAAGRPFIGADSLSAGSTPWNGYMDEFRVTKGYARYTANFTPPTAPFPTR